MVTILEDCNGETVFYSRCNSNSAFFDSIFRLFCWINVAESCVGRLSPSDHQRTTFQIFMNKYTDRFKNTREEWIRKLEELLFQGLQPRSTLLPNLVLNTRQVFDITVPNLIAWDLRSMPVILHDRATILGCWVSLVDVKITLNSIVARHHRRDVFEK